MIRLRSRANEAFSLIEILVVVVIIGILAAAVLSQVLGETDKAKVNRAQSDVQTIATNIQRFYLDMGRYPTSEEGLIALTTQPQDDEQSKWHGPYLTKLSKDPWGRDYVYISPGNENVDSYDLLTYGADGQEGGDGYNADIKHWTDETTPTGDQTNTSATPAAAPAQ